MSARRFFVPPGTLEAEPIRLGPDLAHRAAHVLRLSLGDRVSLFDGSGREAEVELTALARDHADARLLSLSAPDSEPTVSVTLCQALLPSDRFDWVLEKATELGVARFVPLVTARGTAKAEGRGPAAERKQRHWGTVVQAAAEQSGRVRVPEVSAPVTLKDLLPQLPLPAIVAWEESYAPLRPAWAALRLSAPAALCLVVGPEGGLAPEEVRALAGAGATVVSLGPRVLRSETAGVVLAALALYELGAMDWAGA
ncbi:MAG: 16S rRNA (uracil(1498)-N(3))-methyltransferase [Anaerolineae bacterium]